jgi:hypothetical protein
MGGEQEMSYIKAVLPWDTAFSKFMDEFTNWLMNSDRMICNGDMLINYMEDPTCFEEFMNEQHPEYEVE